METDIQIPCEGDGKAVQLFIEGKPVLRTGNFRSRHYKVLEDALKEFNLGFQTKQAGSKNIPILEGEKYKVVGMGTYVRIEKTISFGGESLDYQIGINEEHLELCQNLVADIKLQYVG